MGLLHLFPTLWKNLSESGGTPIGSFSGAPYHPTTALLEPREKEGRRWEREELTEEVDSVCA